MGFILVFFLVLFRCLADCLTPVLYQSGAFLFQKSLRVRHEVLALPNRITSKISAPLFGAQSEIGAAPLGSCDGISSSVIGNTFPSFTSSLHFRSQITTSAPSRATASAIARPTECLPPITTTFFPVRSRVISQASASGINRSSRWKKLLIRSYCLPVLWTSIKNRVMPPPI